MLDRESKARLIDYFEAEELVEYLVQGKFITLETLIDTLEPEIEEALDDLEELIGLRMQKDDASS